MSEFVLIYTAITAGPGADDTFIAPTLVELSILDNDGGLDNTEDGLTGLRYPRGSIQRSVISNTGYSIYNDDNIPTSHPSLPGDTLEDPIRIDISDHDNNAYLGDYPGDSINNPIELDIASDRHSSCDLYNCYTDDVEENPAQTENLIDGRSLHDHFLCKICYENYIDLALGCGHALCYACCNEQFHRSVLGSMHKHTAARDIDDWCIPSKCPFCQRPIRGEYINTELAPQEVDDNLFFTQCVDQEQCFMNGYAVQGIRITMP
ncbi:hypothetical protein BDV24DRAFT_170002 [Aspergillus arachidicola]|uniref:RING-type domain-containing protein n=1 Tax=Aspergillus arachidicola TaxID=656916 RepID=A0A5N6XQL1_9EURO|nr:hypothetical protein BDV24DRAFT_170002 [Aspergillus arachidicola]